MTTYCQNANIMAIQKHKNTLKQKYKQLTINHLNTRFYFWHGLCLSNHRKTLLLLKFLSNEIFPICLSCFILTLFSKSRTRTPLKLFSSRNHPTIFKTFNHKTIQDLNIGPAIVLQNHSTNAIFKTWPLAYHASINSS